MSIKSRQVAGVTTLVVVIVAVAVGLSPRDPRATQPAGNRLARRHAPPGDLPARARGGRRRPRIPTPRCAQDGGIRSPARVRVAYSRNVTYAAIVNKDGIAVAHNFTDQEGQRLPGTGGAAPSSKRSAVALLRRCIPIARSRSGSRCCSAISEFGIDPDRHLDAARERASCARRSARRCRASSSRCSSRRWWRCCWRSGCCGRSTSSRAG